PFAVKDNIDIGGMPTTVACPDFAYTARKDATCVARLRAAGAIPVGKTNLDQFATGLVGVRSPYGAPRNTFDPSILPGASGARARRTGPAHRRADQGRARVLRRPGLGSGVRGGGRTLCEARRHGHRDRHRAVLRGRTAAL